MSNINRTSENKKIENAELNLHKKEKREGTIVIPKSVHTISCYVKILFL